MNKKWVINQSQIKIKMLTANDKTSERRRSPTSGFVSCPNCTKAPRNLLIFNRRWLSCTDDVVLARMAVVEDGGGVSLLGGDELLWRLTLELRFVVAGIIGWIWWGEMGERGATTRAPSGESGVWHCSLPLNGNLHNNIKFSDDKWGWNLKQWNEKVFLEFYISMRKIFQQRKFPSF